MPTEPPAIVWDWEYDNLDDAPTVRPANSRELDCLTLSTDSPGALYCTRPVGHPGGHVAYNRHGEPRLEWRA